MKFGTAKLRGCTELRVIETGAIEELRRRETGSQRKLRHDEEAVARKHKAAEVDWLGELVIGELGRSLFPPFPGNFVRRIHVRSRIVSPCRLSCCDQGVATL